jgi:hypothetical protein
LLALTSAVALLLAVSALMGAAIWRVSGHVIGAPSAPLGFAALLVIGGVCAQLPHGAVLIASIVGVLSAGSLIYLLPLRSSLTDVLWGAGTAVGVVVLAMIPFAVSNRVGLLGVGTNDDLVEHLLASWTLQGYDPLSSNKLISSGYPTGPHSIAAAISAITGMSIEHAFTGLIVAVPAMLALASLPLLPDRSRALRSLAAALVGLCYLQAAYLVQASFKEPIEAVILVGFVAVLWSLETRPTASALRLLPLAVLAAATVYVNSYLGLLWPAGTLLLWAAARMGVRRRRGDARTLRRPVAIAAAMFVALVASEIPRMTTFAQSAYNHERRSVLGNLLHPLPPLEALGIWPRMDFRFDLPLTSLGGILALLAVPALLAALAGSLHRRELALPAALLCCAALWGLTVGRSPYTSAKVLVIAAPVITLLIAREALTWQRAGGRGRRWGTLGAGALGVLLAVGAYSDLELLRDGPVGPSTHSHELAALRAVIGKRPTLFLGSDDYVHWELRGAQVATPPMALYARDVVPLRHAKAQPARSNYSGAGATTTTSRFGGLGLAFDFDSVPSAWLNRFSYVIAPRSGYASPAPSNWRLLRSLRSYQLWRRAGVTPRYGTLTAIDNPGAILDCTTAAGRALAHRNGVAMVQPVPVVGERTRWKGRVGYAGLAAHQTLPLASGRWLISLQYDSSTPVTVRGPGLRVTIPASIEPLGPYWYVGHAHLKRAGRARITVIPQGLPAIGGVLGAFGLTRAPAPTGLRALGRITATRPPSADRLIALRRACGRYVDWYRKSS